MRSATTTLSVAFACVALAVAAAGADLEQARNLLENHEYSAARDAVDEYLRDSPDDPDALLVRANIYSAEGDFDRAADTLEKAVSLRENDVDLLLALAAVYRDKLMRSGLLGKMGNAKKSKAAVEKAFEIDPTNLATRRQLVGYLVHAPGFAGGDKDRGRQIARETIALDEGEGRMLLALALRQKGETEGAVEEYKRVIALDPKNGNAYYMLGELFLEKKDYESADECFRKDIEVTPDEAMGYDGLGDCYLEQKLIDEAIAQYQLALDVDEYFGDSRFKLAKTLQKKKEYDEAVFHYTKLLELTPGHIDCGKAKKQLRKIRKGR
jgi:tetratricopeptide (TPR) repeat protein